MARRRGNEIRVGLLVLAAVAVLVVGILLIGQQNNLFRPTNRYYVLFSNVGGLAAGNPVQLNGVDVGRVQDVILPRDPSESELRVWLTVDERYADRIREDSQARIKTLGLLGDKYIEITSGSPRTPPIPDGGRIETAPATSIDELISSGEDLMDNVTAITVSLRTVLERMERGEGILGQLTKDTPEGKRLTSSIVDTAETVNRIAEKVENGQGPLPRLLNDPHLADQVTRSLDRFEGVLAKADEGEGTVPLLLNDAATAEQVRSTLANLERASGDLARLADDIESSHGLLQRLLTDDEYGAQVSDEIRRTVERVDRLSAEITAGDGTVARLIHDPEIYDAINDIIVGINESKILRWLIRNRQKKGIETRYEEKVESGAIDEVPEGPVPPAAQPPAAGSAPPPSGPPPGGSAEPEPPPPPPAHGPEGVGGAA